MKYLTAIEAKQFAEKWLPAWTGNHPELLAGFYSEDAFYLDPGVPGGVRGKNNLLAYFRKLQDNHRNHIDFMSTVFQFNSFELLVKTVPWVYRSYRAHGFSFDYFPLELESWKNAIKKYLDPAAAGEINAVYDWMLKHHNEMIKLSAVLPNEDETFPELKDERKKIGACLLAADFRNGMKIAESILARENGQEALYLGLIKPAMYEIGRLWEQDKISIAEEHLATSMVGRILSGLYVKLPLPSPDKGKAIVTAAPNEFHELGGRILADMLEAADHEVPRNVLRGALLLSGNIIHSI